MPGFEHLEIEGLLSIKSASIDLRPINVLVGANGAGKSNIIRAFELLGRIFDERLKLHVTKSGGASTLIHAGTKGPARIRLLVSTARNGYEVVFEPTVRDGLAFAEERVHFQGDHGPVTRVLATGGEESELRRQEETEGGYSMPGYARSALAGCRVYHFHDTSPGAPVKAAGSTADNIALRPDAGNLAAFLLRLRQQDRPVYDRIVTTVRTVAPFFGEFVLAEESPGMIRLRWQHRDSDVVFGPESMSDGTLRFICLITLLLSPERPAIIVLDEPELGLHPLAIAVFAEFLRIAAQESQVIMATQSVTLLDFYSIDELIIVERVLGSTVMVRPNPEKLRIWLEEYSLSELWTHNYLGGLPRPDSSPRPTVL